jgi:hypothetical protein
LTAGCESGWATGPTTCTKIRTFVVWPNKSKVNTALHLDAPQARSSRFFTQDQRLAWIKGLLADDIESLPYRVAGTLLLLYAQPLIRIVALPRRSLSPPTRRAYRSGLNLSRYLNPSLA